MRNYLNSEFGMRNYRGTQIYPETTGEEFHIHPYVFQKFAKLKIIPNSELNQSSGV